MIEHGALREALVEFLPKQRWFGGSEADAASAEVVEVNTLRDTWPALVQALVRVPSHGGTSTYQVVLGLRPVESHDNFLEGKGDAIIGDLESSLGTAVAYDAVIDPELAFCLLERTAPDAVAERARLLGADQSNTSIVFDEKLIMKLFRRIDDGPNPDVEVAAALAAGGFGAIARPVGAWEGGGGHLAVVSEFLAGGTDGFHLALTSLRDLYDARTKAFEAGGDFGPDASRLGSIVAEMHVALAASFGAQPPDTASWIADMQAQLGRLPRDVELDRARVQAQYDRLASIDVGPAIRIHGDLHLGQVMRTDDGWHVLDFEGEPARPLEERRRPSSPLRDVAGMLRSFHYAAAVGLREYGGDADDEVLALAAEWDAHNRTNFLEGYFGTAGVDAVLPRSEVDRSLVLAAFELDKAVYEIAYEASHRPEWVGIPLTAVHRILEEAARGHRTA